MKVSLFRLLQRIAIISVFFLHGMPVARADLSDSLALMEAQSPIDIRSDSTYYGNLPALDFDLSPDTALTVINNGSPGTESTIRANVSPGEGSLMLSGHRWDLAQFHFHTPSEHLINGHSTPLEMHLVFTDSADNLLVVGRGVKQGLFKNHALEPIFSELPQTTEETLHIDHFNLNALLPGYLGSFRYSGSLTTPPFSEGVSWVELASPLYLSGSQIEAFEALFPDGNTREVQELNGRIVLTDVPLFVNPLGGTGAVEEMPVLGAATTVPEPQTYAMLLAGLSLMGLIFFRRRQALSLFA